MRNLIAEPCQSAPSQLCGREVEFKKRSLGKLQWTGRYLVEWEILIYGQESSWEACFFKWGVHHEHVKASSLVEARRKAEEHIGLLNVREARLNEFPLESIELHMTRPIDGVIPLPPPA